MVSKIFAGLVLLFSSLLCCSCAGDVKDDSAKLKRVLEMYEKYEPTLGKIKTITAPEVYKGLESKEFIIVDVRKPKEQYVSMLPGAITLNKFEKDKSKYKNNKIVFYCTIGYRSGLKVSAYQKEGFDVYNLKGSILAWVLSGYEVYHKKKAVKNIHVYGSTWNIVPKDYKAIW